MKQSNRSQQLYLVNVSVVIMLLVLVGILAVVLPKPTVSEVEKRELAAKPQWSLRSWFSGEYAEQYDAYYADTFPQREQLFSRPMPNIPVMATWSSAQQVGSSQG